MLLAQEIEAENKPRADTPATSMDNTSLAAERDSAPPTNGKSEAKDKAIQSPPSQESDVKMSEAQGASAPEKSVLEQQTDTPTLQAPPSSVPTES